MMEVYKSDLPKNQKAIALAYADHADDTGNNIFPSYDYTAWKTGYTRQSVISITKKLVESGVLKHRGFHESGTNHFQIIVENLPDRPPFERSKKKKRGIKILPPKIEKGGSKNLTEGVKKFDSEGSKNLTEGGKTVLPKPSLEPSIETSGEPSRGNQPTLHQLKIEKAKKAKPYELIAEFYPELNTAEFLELWAEWVDYRKTIKNKLTPNSTVRQLNKCQEHGFDKSKYIIELSMENDWKGLIWEKLNQHKNGRSPNGQSSNQSALERLKKIRGANNE